MWWNIRKRVAWRRYPAFVVVFGIVGALLFVTASVGVLSADLAACGVGVFIFGCYQALMMVLVVLQLAALVFYHTDSLRKRRSPPDSGEHFLPCYFCKRVHGTKPPSPRTRPFLFSVTLQVVASLRVCLYRKCT